MHRTSVRLSHAVVLFISALAVACSDASDEPLADSTSYLTNCVAAAPPSGPIDVLPYMFAPQAQSIGGFEQVQSAHPDGAGLSTFVGYQFGGRESFLVYPYDNQSIYLRYEVTKDAGWIREFEELSKKGTGSGAIWSPRFVVPGGPGVLSTYSLDRSVLTGSTWTHDAAGSVASNTNFISWRWAPLDVGSCQAQVLRMTQEWDTNAHIFEDYDYMNGQGFVHWQWNERLDFLMSRPAGAPNQYFAFWDQGTSNVIEVDASTTPPKATAISGGSRTPLGVVQWTSHYTGAAAWYVTTRASVAGSALVPQARYPVDPPNDFLLGGGQSLATLPRVNTVAPSGAAGAGAAATSVAIAKYVDTNLYQGLLGHPSDAAGLAYWVRTATSGANGCAQLAVYFIDTAEFLTLQKGLSSSGYVTRLYQALLGRAPDAPGLTSATTALDGGTMKRSTLAKSILSSAEFDGRCKSAYGFASGAGSFSDPTPF